MLDTMIKNSKRGDLKTTRTARPKQTKDRHILLAVDESENAKRAVLYVADFLGGLRGIRVTLLHIIPEPSDDYFFAETERVKWLEEQRTGAIALSDKYRNILIQSGFRKDKVSVVIDTRYCSSVAECILEQQKKLDCCTVVIGRRGISKKEEFMFGSTSNKLLHSAENCALWVIE